MIYCLLNSQMLKKTFCDLKRIEYVHALHCVRFRGCLAQGAQYIHGSRFYLNRTESSKDSYLNYVITMPRTALYPRPSDPKGRLSIFSGYLNQEVPTMFFRIYKFHSIFFKFSACCLVFQAVLDHNSSTICQNIRVQSWIFSNSKP